MRGKSSLGYAAADRAGANLPASKDECKEGEEESGSKMLKRLFLQE